MDLDFEKINERIIGIGLESRPNQGGITAGRRTVKTIFKEFIRPYCEETHSRWEVYARMRDKFDYLREKQMSSTKNMESLTQDELEELKRDSFTAQSLRSAMELMVDVYLSKGKINNEP